MIKVKVNLPRMRLEDNACQLTRGKFKRQLIQLLRAPTLRLPKGVLSIPLAMLASGIVVFVVFESSTPTTGKDSFEDNLHNYCARQHCACPRESYPYRSRCWRAELLFLLSLTHPRRILDQFLIIFVLSIFCVSVLIRG